MEVLGSDVGDFLIDKFKPSTFGYGQEFSAAVTLQKLKQSTKYDD